MSRVVSSSQAGSGGRRKLTTARSGHADGDRIPRRQRHGSLARLAEARGVLRSDGGDQHPDVCRSHQPHSRRRAHGRARHGRGDGRDGDPCGGRGDGLRRRCPRDAGAPHRGVSPQA